MEVPEFRRCCFCIPLRCGLLVWGYVRLILSIIFFIGLAFLLSIMLRLRAYYMSQNVDFHLRYPLFLVFTMVLLIMDISFIITFIVGGHKKSVKPLKTYYIYCIVILVLTILLGTILTILDLISLTSYYTYEYKGDTHQLLAISFIFVKLRITIGILYNASQLYFLMMLRSEIKKLENNSQFRFVNNAVESQCFMELDEGKPCERINGMIAQGNGTVVQDNETVAQVNGNNAQGSETVAQVNENIAEYNEVVAQVNGNSAQDNAYFLLHNNNVEQTDRTVKWIIAENRIV